MGEYNWWVNLKVVSVVCICGWFVFFSWGVSKFVGVDEVFFLILFGLRIWIL